MIKKMTNMEDIKKRSNVQIIGVLKLEILE